MQFRCPNCQHPIRIEEEDRSINATQDTVDGVTCPSCNSRFSLSAEETTTFNPKSGMKVGHFDVLEVLGEGAFGTVFKCFDTELNRFVAIKVPREGRVTADSSKLFLREARSAAAINHPNVIAVYEVGQHADGFYIASEFIDGVTLSEILKLRAYSPKEAAELMVKLLRAVQVFHDKGIVHRDMKSGNILIDTQGEPHIADFGLARREGPQEITVTHDGKIIGTPAYMSPEQARGDTKAITASSDQYSLGVIFYELLTRDRPFHATNSRTLLHRILTEQPRNPRSVNKAVPVDLDTICVKALEKDPAERYSSVGEMADDVQRFLDSRPILARPASSILKLQRWAARNPMVAALSSIVSVLVIVAGLLLTNRPIASEQIVRIQAPKAKTLDVSIPFAMHGTQVPANPTAEWAIVPLEKLTGRPIKDGVKRFETTGELSTQLEPGRYLVVIKVRQFGFHEVYRTVPEDPSSLPAVYLSEKWTKKSANSLELPTVTVWQTDIANAGMIEVSGGSFVVGEHTRDSPRQSEEVLPYLFDQTEVTNEEFDKVTQRPAQANSNEEQRRYPVVGINWLQASDFAERVGKRLPSESEFEFAATNQGTTQFPWGDDATKAPASSLTSADIVTVDVCRDLPIRNLCTNAGEWTSDVLNPYRSESRQVPEAIAVLNATSRVVRGIGYLSSDSANVTESGLPLSKTRFGWSYVNSHRLLGFRCARSQKPSY